MKKCPKCSTEFSSDTPGGLCPTCLLQQGLETPTRATTGPQTAGPDLASPHRQAAPLMSTEELMAILPQFDQIEFIGRGGMGVVYKARQKNLDRFIALKILSPEVAGAAGFADRFAREARAMARLNHPNIVSVYDFGFVPRGRAELCYFTMEFVDGSNLRELLKQLASQQALAIVPQICEALQYAHDIGIVHRDIKPENILVDKKGKVKIADFGLAKLLEQARTSSDYTLTRADMAMGTPAYMAPEQLERPTEVDHRADLYSLGVVFYEMLTGQLPKGRFLLPSQRVQIDVRFDEVVLKALEHDVERRYQHASEVQTSVELVRSTPQDAPAAPNASEPPLSAVTSESSGRARPPVLPPIARESWKLYARAAGLYLFAWIAFPFLWNLGWIGFVFAISIFMAATWRATHQLLQFRPEVVNDLATLPRWRKIGRVSNLILFNAVAFALLLMAVALNWDEGGGQKIADIFEPHTLTEPSQDLLKDFQRVHPQALPGDIRDLTLKPDIATYPNGITMANWQHLQLPTRMLSKPPGPSAVSSFLHILRMIVNALFVPTASPPEFRGSNSLLPVGLGLLFFITIIPSMVGARKFCCTGRAWNPAWKLGIVLVMTFLVVSFFGGILHGLVHSFGLAHLSSEMVRDQSDKNVWHSILTPPSARIERRVPLDNLFLVLDRWAIDHGYEVAALTSGNLEDTHREPAAPTKVTYQAVVLWKPNIFDRLSVNWEGLWSAAPEIFVQSARNDEGSITTVAFPAHAQIAAECRASRRLLDTMYSALTAAVPNATSSTHLPGEGPAPLFAAQSASTQPDAGREAELKHFNEINQIVFSTYTTPGSAAAGEKLARDALFLAEKFPDELLTITAVNQAHTVLGLEAIHQGDLADAKTHLMQSISARSNPIINSFGPNLTLASVLLARGERQAVMEFLDESARFYVGAAEHLHRRHDLIAAGHTPDDMIYHDPSEPLFGRWFSLEPILHTIAIVTFSPDGTAAYLQRQRSAGRYQVVDGKLSITDGQTQVTSKLGAFTLDRDQLHFAETQSDSYLNNTDTDGKPLVFQRIGKGTDLVGSWTAKARILDAGEAQFNLVFAADGTGSIGIDMSPTSFQYRYALDGTKLRYWRLLNGKSQELAAKASFDGPQLILSGFPLPTPIVENARFKREEAAPTTTAP